jgi:hypothetical protein
MSVGYVSYAAPVATTPATLGVTTRPATTGTTTAGGNAAIPTGFDRTPIAGGGTTQPTLAQATQAAAAANGASVQAINTVHNTVSGQFGTQAANDLVTASGGGAISDALKGGVSRIVAFAQKGMADIQKAIQGDMAANNGEVDPAKMQLYTMKMSTYELLNQMAAKIQEKEERSIQIWLR